MSQVICPICKKEVDNWESMVQSNSKVYHMKCFRKRLGFADKASRSSQ